MLSPEQEPGNSRLQQLQGIIEFLMDKGHGNCRSFSQTKSSTYAWEDVESFLLKDFLLSAAQKSPGEALAPLCGTPNSGQVRQKEQPQPQPQRTRRRTVFTRDQVTILQRCFRMQPQLSCVENQLLSAQVGLTPVQVKNWFQNRKAKLKRRPRKCIQPQAAVCQARWCPEVLESSTSTQLSFPTNPSHQGYQWAPPFNSHHYLPSPTRPGTVNLSLQKVPWVPRVAASPPVRPGNPLNGPFQSLPVPSCLSPVLISSPQSGPCAAQAAIPSMAAASGGLYASLQPQLPFWGPRSSLPTSGRGDAC